MPSEDPYAQYLTPPSGDPYAQYLTPPGAAAPAAKSPALGGVADPANWALAGLDHLGMGLATKNPFMAMPDQLKQDVAQAHQNLGLADYPLAAAAYAVGPGKILGPAGAAIGGAGIGGMAAEGALAGGASAAIQDPTNLGGVAAGALEGGAIGGAAGGLTKGVNAGLTKAFAKPGAIDPAAAIAQTGKDSADAYAALHQVPASPTQIAGAIKSATSGLDPSVLTGMSPGLKNTIATIHNTVQDLPQANMGQVDSWQRQINSAAQREGHPTDAVVAGKINSALDGVIQNGGAGDLQDAAQAAFKKATMAQKLADWQQTTAAGGSAGQAPLTEAKNWYSGPGDQDNFNTLAGLANQNQGHNWTTNALGHLASHALGVGGYTVGGFPGSIVGEALGHLYVKPAIYAARKGADQASKVRAFQAVYPQLTGQPLTGATQAPRVGDWLKNLALGGMY